MLNLLKFHALLRSPKQINFMQKENALRLNNSTASANNPSPNKTSPPSSPNPSPTPSGLAQQAKSTGVKLKKG
jgi:hypothetical protein